MGKCAQDQNMKFDWTAIICHAVSVRASPCQIIQMLSIEKIEIQFGEC